MQIVHKLLLDLLNAALRQETVKLHRSRALRSAGVGGGPSEVLPRGRWHELPEDDDVVSGLVESASQQVVGWLSAAQRAEPIPIEVLLSSLLPGDTADLERSWADIASHKEALIAHVADHILLGLIAELGELKGRGEETKAVA